MRVQCNTVYCKIQERSSVFGLFVFLATVEPMYNTIWFHKSKPYIIHYSVPIIPGWITAEAKHYFFSLQGVRLYNGLYSVFLCDWLKVFPREQVLVVRMEDYHQDMVSSLATIYNHLGLSKFEYCFQFQSSKVPFMLVKMW